MEESSHLDKENLLKVLKKSYSPYSKFRVSAQIVEETSEQSFFGCNVENASFGATVCAERSAISNMVSEVGSTARIKEIHIISDQKAAISPCGICRQSLAEFATLETKIFCYGADFNDSRVYTLSQLLPMAFTEF
jgi:cytidine deaminase